MHEETWARISPNEVLKNTSITANTTMIIPQCTCHDADSHGRLRVFFLAKLEALVGHVSPLDVRAPVCDTRKSGQARHESFTP